MPAGADLHGQARQFAGHITSLLNRTVTNGVRLRVVLYPQDGRVRVGGGLTKSGIKPLPVPLTVSQASPRAWLLVAYVLDLDPEREHLTVLQSACSLYLDEDRRSPILRYEYVREPSDSHPAAHLQVHGVCEALDELCRRSGLRRALHRFHLPVGGRRYRPSIEDVIEFLVVEGLVEALDRLEVVWLQQACPQLGLEAFIRNGCPQRLDWIVC